MFFLMLAGLIVILIESCDKKIKVFLVSIDYYEYFEVVSTFGFVFFSSILNYIFKTNIKN